MNSEYNKLSADIRFLDLKIESLTAERNNYGNLIFVADKMLKIQPLILCVGFAVGFLCGVLLNISKFIVSGMVYGALGFSVSALLSTMAAIYYGVGKVIYTKKYNKLQSELIEVEERKYELEKEMFNIKKHKNDIKTTVTLDNGNTISFSNDDDLVVESIFAKYNGEKKKTKKLTLKK